MQSAYRRLGTLSSKELGTDRFARNDYVCSVYRAYALSVLVHQPGQAATAAQRVMRMRTFVAEPDIVPKIRRMSPRLALKT